jgi:hypothetical protein
MIITHIDNSFKESVILKIDEIADSTRQKMVGDPIRLKEYEITQYEANMFKANNYEGTVPPSVQSWIDVKNCSPKQACDEILSASNEWISVIYKIRDLRLKAKEAIRKSNSASQINNLYSDYEQSLNALLT